MAAPILPTDRNPFRDGMSKLSAVRCAANPSSHGPGPLTVNFSRLDSFLPYPVQATPLAAQSVVTGRNTVTFAHHPAYL